MLHAVYLIAIVAEAVSGTMAAGRRNMDLFGACFVGCVTALGGGSVRDMLLGHYPLGWVQHPEYIWFTAGAALIGAMLGSMLHYLRTVFLTVDALGLVAFTLIGCNIAMETGQTSTIVILSGIITGCLGGIMRDLLCGDVPVIFKREMYASISLLIGAGYLVLLNLQVSERVSVMICLGFGFILRMSAIYFDWHIPKLVYRDKV